MAFQQAQIPVQKTKEFERLAAAIERVFSEGSIERLLKRIQSGGVRIREFEKVLEKSVLEAVDPVLAGSGKTAKQLYTALTLSDQALMREFYLERIERVDAKIRQQFQKIYRYY